MIPLNDSCPPEGMELVLLVLRLRGAVVGGESLEFRNALGDEIRILIERYEASLVEAFSLERMRNLKRELSLLGSGICPLET